MPVKLDLDGFIYYNITMIDVNNIEILNKI